MNYVILAIGIIILAFDGYLAAKDRKTISQWCQELLPTWADWIVGVAGWIGLCVIKHYWPEFDAALMVFLAGFWGHIWLPNRERYKQAEQIKQLTLGTR